MPQPIQLFDPISSTYTYILWDKDTREAIIIDPVDTLVERDMQVLSEQRLRLVWSVETHAHADHITSSGILAEQLAARTAAPAGCGIGTAGRQLEHGDTLTFGKETLQALHTPGHTAGSMSFVWRNHVFTGDTLLINGCGRTDFQSGSAEQMYHSLTQVLLALPDSTTVWPGHDYKGNTHSSIGRPQTTASETERRAMAAQTARNGLEAGAANRGQGHARKYHEKPTWRVRFSW